MLDRMVRQRGNNWRGRGGFNLVRPEAQILPQEFSPPQESNEPDWGSVVGQAAGGLATSFLNSRKEEPPEKGGLSPRGPIPYPPPIYGNRPDIRLPNQQKFAGFFAQGGTIPKDKWGLVGDEIVENDDGTVRVRPAEQTVDLNQPEAVYSNRTVADFPNAEKEMMMEEAPRMTPTIDSRVADASERYQSDLTTPAKKHKKWKDIAYMAASVLSNAFNEDKVPVQSYGEGKKQLQLGRDREELGGLQQQQQIEQGTRQRNANIAIAEGKPDLAKAEATRKQRLADITEFKAINDADYKTNMVQLGKEKADEIRKNNERIFDLRARGLDQTDKRIQILEKRNDEIQRHNTVTEGQGAAKIKGAAETRDFKKEVEQIKTQKGEAKARQQATTTFTNLYMKAHKGKLPSPEEVAGYLGTIGLQ